MENRDEREKRNKFNYLSLTDKAQLVSDFGKTLMRVDSPDGKYYIVIYDVECTFVEVFYNVRTKQIDQIWMPSYEELSCYMQYISIDSIKEVL